MKVKLLVFLAIVTFCYTVSAQETPGNGLRTLEQQRNIYQKKVAAENTKNNGLRLRAINEEIVNYVIEHGYKEKVALATKQTAAVVDIDNPNKVVAHVRAGDILTIYERIGKHKFMVKTKDHLYGVVDKEVFGMAIHEYPIEVLVDSASPEERTAKFENGAIEQRMILDFD